MFPLTDDLEFEYFLNDFKYLEKHEDRDKSKTLDEHACMKLMDSFVCKGRNVITDNSFTSHQPVNSLWARGNVIFGAVLLIRTEIPTICNDIITSLFLLKVLLNGHKILTVYRCDCLRLDNYA